jgi:hypothetical protein
VSIINDTDHYVYILTHTISFRLRPPMKVNIHNQCSDFNLTNRNWYKTHASWNKEPAEEINAGNMMSAVLTSSWAGFRGMVIYQLQKCAKSDDQLESIYTLFFIAWKHECYKKLRVFVKLIECDKTFHWNKIGPKEYYQRYASQLSTYTGPIKDTWLIHDGIVLMTRLELNFTQSDDELNIVISEGVKDEHIKRPVWIHPGRWVSLKSKTF